MQQLDQLIEGYRRFREQDWARERDRWSELAEGQSPKIMILSCADSRVEIVAAGAIGRIGRAGRSIGASQDVAAAKRTIGVGRERDVHATYRIPRRILDRDG